MGSKLEVQATPSDEIVLEELRRWYDSIWSKAEAINAKAGVLLAFQGAVILILLGNPGEFFKQLGVAPWWVQGLAALDGILFLGGVVFSMRTLVSYPFPYPSTSRVQKAQAKTGKCTTVEEEQESVPTTGSSSASEKKQVRKPFDYLERWKDVERHDFLRAFLDSYAEVVRESVSSVLEKNREYIKALWMTAGFAMLLLFTAILVYWG